MDRARRKEQADRAYEDLKSTQGAMKATLYGLTLVTLAHYTWPLFRRQTLAIKGNIYLEHILITAGTIFGLVVGADTALLSHEAEHRRVEDRLRREARIALARQGKVPTEPEIAKWIARRDANAAQSEERTSS